MDFLRGHYDRAEHWLTDALKFAGGSASMKAQALTYLGSVDSDRANYRRAADLLGEGLQQAFARACQLGDPW